jgi:tRNA(fMet)-specific endonuclease VapC
MNRYVLDTNHASAILNDDQKLLDRLAASAVVSDLSLCRPSVAELWYMVFNSQRIEENRARLERVIATFPVLEFDDRAAIEYGKLRAERRRIGRNIPAIDALIASIARSNDVVLLTADADFHDIAGLATENWLT